MTPHLQKAFDFIKAYDAEHGFAPTYDEIARGMGNTSKGGAYRLVEHLELLGRVKVQAGRNRGISIAEDATFHLRALLGAIKSGDAHAAAQAGVAAEIYLANRGGAQ